MDAGRTHVIVELETTDLIIQHSKQNGISMMILVPLVLSFYRTLPILQNLISNDKLLFKKIDFRKRKKERERCE